MKAKKLTDEEFINLVKTSLSYSELIRKLGLKPAGGNFDKVKREIKKLNLDISHMTGKGWNKNERYKQIKVKKNLEEILIKNSTFISTSKLRQRLIKEGIKKHICECCKKEKWFDKPIPLELHHINSIKDDLRLENLQILCPNCHALTDNYRGKNIKK